MTRFTQDFLDTIRSKSAVFVADVDELGHAAAEEALRQGLVIHEQRLTQLGLQGSAVVPVRRSAIDTIDAVVATAFQVDVGLMLSHSRRADATLPRQVAIYVAPETTYYSSTQLAQHYGFKDHTMVLYAQREIPKRLRAGKLPCDVAALIQQARIALEDATDRRYVAKKPRLRAVS